MESAVSCNVPAYTGHGVVVEDAARKRELRLLKNRWAIRIDLCKVQSYICISCNTDIQDLPMLHIHEKKNPLTMKNILISIFNVYREAARECRRKKKEYIKCLENRVAVLENRNQTLIDELKSLKELYQQKTDWDWCLKPARQCIKTIIQSMNLYMSCLCTLS